MIMMIRKAKYLILFFICLKLIHGKTAPATTEMMMKPSVDFIRSVPKFTDETLNKAYKMVLFDNASLNTVVLTVKAVTYASALPITYELIDKKKKFTIDGTNGIIRLFSPLNDIHEYSFTIVAKDSATFGEQQKSYLPVNVQVMSSIFHEPKFDHKIAYHISVPEITPINSIVYDDILVYDKNYGQRGSLEIDCDTSHEVKGSCQFFKVESKLIRPGEYRVFVRLIASVKNQLKKKLLLPITARLAQMKTTNNLVISVHNNEMKMPKFDKPKYLLALDVDSQISNVLEVAVNNVDMNSISNSSFRLIDPNQNFILSSKPPRCDEKRTCRQTIQLRMRPKIPNQYIMTIEFQLDDSIEKIPPISAPIYVVIRPRKEPKEPPKFVNTPTEFFLFRTIQHANDLTRNATFYVSEDVVTSLFNAGFYVDILNSDMSPLVDDLFEVVPNYGLGFMASALRVKNSNLLANNHKYDLILRAKSRMNESLATHKNITIYLIDRNQHTPYFPYRVYSVILNIDSENKRLDNELIQVQAFDDDPNENITYSIIGEDNNRRFTIDSLGRLFLALYFDFTSDETDFMYNITIMAMDKAGHSNFTSVVVNLSVTLPLRLRKNLFECAMSAFRSELNQFDRRTLNPPLFISANSEYQLKYAMAKMTPKLNEIQIDENTGEVILIAPLNITISQIYSKVELIVQIFQLRLYENILLYSSSVKCPATIYLNSIESLSKWARSTPPVFLRTQYTASIYEETLSKITPIIKVEAVSTNSSIHSPLIYSLVNERERFIIDSAQGFIYPRHDLSLEPGVYPIKVETIETMSGLRAETTVYLNMLRKSKTDYIECSQDYIVLRVDSENYFLNETVNLSQLGCSSAQLQPSMRKDKFSSSMSRVDQNSHTFRYELFSHVTTHDCDGREIADYIPNVGIDPTTGRLVSFEKLSRRNFCDATFLITIHKDDLSLLVPLKLIISSQSSEKIPQFENGPNQVVVFKSNYIHVSSYVTTVVAYDPVTLELIEDYSIVSQMTTPSSEKTYFKIDPRSGVITLNEFPLIKNAELSVMARSESGLTATTNIMVDLSSYFSNYGSNLILSTGSNPNNNLILRGSKIRMEPLVRNEIECIIGPQQEIGFHGSKLCQNLEYSLNYFEDQKGEKDSDLIIDKKDGHVFIKSYRASEVDSNPQNRVLILNAEKHSNSNRYPSRFVDSVQESYTITSEPVIERSLPVFEQKLYSFPVLNTLSADSTILALKYNLSTTAPNSQEEIEFYLDELSNNEIAKYFQVVNEPEHNTIYVRTKVSPLRIDRPEINFMIASKKRNSTDEDFERDEDYSSPSPKYHTRVNIRVMDASGRTASKQPSFKSPSLANYLLTLNFTDANHPIRVYNSSIFELNAPSPIGSLVSYRILNEDSPFRIVDENIISLAPEALYSKFLRNSYLLFIQAFDLFYPSLYSTFTTLEVRVNREIRVFPYFKRNLFGGPLNLVINGNYTPNVPLYDLKSLVYIPSGCSSLYFYVFNLCDHVLSDLFYVESSTFTIRLKKFLTNQNPDYVFALFIYVTNSPYTAVTFPNPSPNNTQLLFLNLIFKGYVNSNNFFFLDYSANMVIEDLVPTDFLIGFVKANLNTGVVYKIEECNLVINMAVLKDSNFCRLFKIDSITGLISTNSSNFVPFKNSFFSLEISATAATSISNQPIKIIAIANVYIANRFETPRIIFRNFPIWQRGKALQDLSRSVNQALNIRYPGVYEFSYSLISMPQLPSNSSNLDICFHILNKNQNIVLDFQHSKSILLDLFNIRVIFELFSIKGIERCSNRLDYDFFKYFYDCFGNWKLTASAIVLIVLIGVVIILTMIAIFLLCCCWLSNMRQALIAPTFDVDNVDSNSNNFLID